MKKLIVPAILVKDKDEFKRRIQKVKPYVTRVQIDIMDGKFVPNRTLQPSEMDFSVLDDLEIEYHLMVENPLDYVKQIGKSGQMHAYQFHIESFKSAAEIETAISFVKKIDAKVFLALSPDTPVSSVFPYIQKIDGVLIMTVYPGFSGQAYLTKMGDKIKALRKMSSVLQIEVDGGITKETIKHAAACGANLFGAANAVFGAQDIGQAVEELLELANSA